MVKRFLLSYRIHGFHSFDETGFKMTILSVYLFGLYKRVHTIDYFIPSHHSILGYTKHWDKLIKDKTPLINL